MINKQKVLSSIGRSAEVEHRRRATLLAALVDLLLLVNVYVNGRIYELSENARSVALAVLVVLFVLGKALLLLVHCKKIRVKHNWFSFAVLLVVVAAHQELNVQFVCPNESSAHVHALSQWYCSHSPFVLGVLYCDLSELLFGGKLLSLQILVACLFSVRRVYKKQDLAKDITSALLNLLAVCFAKQLYFRSAAEQSESGRRPGDPRRPGREKSYYGSKGSKEGAKMVPVYLSAQVRSTKMIYKQQMPAGEVKPSSLSQEKYNRVSLDSEPLEEERAVDGPDRQHEPIDIGFDYEYCFVFVNDKRKIQSIVKRTFDRKKNDLYLQLQQAVDENHRLDIASPDEKEASPKNKSFSGKRVSLASQLEWKFSKESLNHAAKKIRFWATSGTLQEVIDDLNKEYGKAAEEGSGPYCHLVEALASDLKKCASLGTDQPVPANGFAMLLRQLDKKKKNQLDTEISYKVIQTPKISKQALFEAAGYAIEFEFSFRFTPKSTRNTLKGLTLERETEPGPSIEAEDQEHFFEARILPIERVSKDRKKSTFEFHLFMRKREVQKAGQGAQMLNFISHEMRSPLLAVMGFIKLFGKESLEHPFGSDPRFRALVAKYLKSCEQNIMNLLDACVVILDVAKNGVNKEIKGGEFDLRKLVYETLKIFLFDLSKNKDRKLFVKFFEEPKRELREILEEQERELIEQEEKQYMMVHQQEELQTISDSKQDHKKKVKFSQSSQKLIEKRTDQDKHSAAPEKNRNKRDFIRSDPTRIKQILVNLVSNALKYTVHGAVTVAVEELLEESPSLSRQGFKRERSLKVCVQDSGIGIKEADLKKLFKEFGRISNEMDQMLNSGGIGLGLLLSNKMSKQLSPLNKKAGIEVKSELNRGSTFSFYIKDMFKFDFERDILAISDPKVFNIFSSIANRFKALDEREAEQKEMLGLEANFAIVRQYAQNNVVCIVDDSEINLEILMDMLDNLSFKVRACSNPSEALENIRNKYTIPCDKCKLFNMLIVDYEMPIMTGAELARKVRDIGPEYRDIPIICASAQELDISEEPFRVFTNQLVKPISMESVINIMRMHIKKVEPHSCKYQGSLRDWNQANRSRYMDITESKGFHNQSVEDQADLEPSSLEERQPHEAGLSRYVFVTNPTDQLLLGRRASLETEKHFAPLASK